MKKCKLGEIADFKTGPFGTQFSSSEYTSTGIPMINIENISNGRLVEGKLQYISEETKKRLSVHVVKEGDIVFGRAGSVDRHLYIFNEYEGYVQGSNCIRMRPTINVNSRYLSYYLLLPSVKKQILNQSAGSVQAFLNTDKLKSINIVIQDDADRIAKFLDSIESKIFVNNKAIRTLESLSKTLYDYYFLQFDFPDEKGRPYKSSGGKMEYNAELGREIPAGWKVKPLSRFFQNERNGEWGTDEITKTNQLKVTCIRGADFPAANGYESLKSPIRFISPQKSDRIVQAGDLIIEISGGSPTQSTGRVCYINQELLNRIDSPTTTSNFCKIVSIANKDYFYFAYMTWQRLYESNAFFNFEGKTTGLKNLLFDMAVSSIKLACPPADIVRKYQVVTQRNFSKIQSLADENRHLTALRDFLLPLLMNGQVGFKTPTSPNTKEAPHEP